MRPLRCSSRVGEKGISYVDHAVALELEVDALACGVGGEQDADRRAIGRRLELRLDALALVDIHAAVEQRDALASEPVARPAAPAASAACRGTR